MKQMESHKDLKVGNTSEALVEINTQMGAQGEGIAAFPAGPDVNFPKSLSSLYTNSTVPAESVLQNLNFYCLGTHRV